MTRRVPGTGAALGTAVYVLIVVVVMSAAVGAAARAGVLVPVALPLGLALVAVLAWLPPRTQVAGWSTVTALLLAPTYLGSGGREYLALGVLVILAVLGWWRSGWYLVAAWALHPLWDLLPRDLPAVRHDLPRACLVYDLVVAAYLAWALARGRLSQGRTTR